MTAAPETDHDDLMDIASRFAYLDDLGTNRNQVNTIRVNGTIYRVLDVEEDLGTGLDAFTFENTVTHEVTVAFQGSDGMVDWQNNALLVTSATPAQFAAAEAYVQKIGDVDFVCGNSLGGGLAAYVAARDGDLQGVTVNPAPVPAALADVDAPNVHNYLTGNDMLHQLVLAGGLGDRVIGRSVVVPGTATNDVFGDNHIGADREGVYDASMATPFSLFRPDQVLSPGSRGARVDIDVDNLTLMARGLHAQLVDLRSVLGRELTTVGDDLEDHAVQLAARDEQVRDLIVGVVESAYAEVRQAVERAREAVEAVRAALRRVTCPRLVTVFWQPVGDVLLGALRAALDAVEELDEFASHAAAEAAWLVHGVHAVDTSRAITDSLVEQNRTLERDLRTVSAKWKTFTTMSTAVAALIDQVDADLASAIAAGRCPPDALPVVPGTWPAARVQGVTEAVAQSFCQAVTEARSETTAFVIAGLGGALAGSLAPLSMQVKNVDAAMELLEVTLAGALTGLEDAVEAVQGGVGGVVARALHVDDDLDRFRESVLDLRDEYRRRSDEIQDVLRAVARVIDALPDLVRSCRPQVESMIFPDELIQTAYDSYSRCRNLVARSETAYREAHHQLADHRATTIDALADRACQVQDDLGTIEASLTEMLG